MLNNLADFFGVSVDYLLGRTDIRNPGETIKYADPEFYRSKDRLPPNKLDQLKEYAALLINQKLEKELVICEVISAAFCAMVAVVIIFDILYK